MEVARLRRAFTSAALLAAGGACSGERAEVQVEYRDSVGIVIVESFAPQWGGADAWLLDSLPFFALSGPGAAYEFAGVPDATVLSDGRLVVLDEGSHQVRFFDQDGEFLHAIGREGEGPGDFERLTSVSEFRGDSVLVFDYWLRRGTILDGTGTLSRVMMLGAELQVQELDPVVDGSLVAKTWSLETFMEIQGAYRAQYQIRGVAADGVVGDTIATIAGWSGFKVNREDGRSADYAPLFLVDGHLSVSSAGIVLGSADRMEFSRYSTAGELERIVRVPSLDEPLDDEEIRAERAAMLRPESSGDMRRLVESLPAPEMRPAYSDLQIDSEGFVWVARYWSRRRHADDPVLWYVFDPNGAWLGGLTTPARFSVLEIGVDYVLGTRRDEYDVEGVEFLRLTR